MRNQTLINAAKNILKDLLHQCTEGQQLQFKRMYSHKNLDRPIDDVVDCMDVDCMDWAITQCEYTLEKSKKILNKILQFQILFIYLTNV